MKVVARLATQPPALFPQGGEWEVEDVDSPADVDAKIAAAIAAALAAALANGSYTPVVTIVDNPPIGAAAAVDPFTFARVGNVMRIIGRLVVTSNALSSGRLDFTLPPGVVPAGATFDGGAYAMNMTTATGGAVNEVLGAEASIIAGKVRLTFDLLPAIGNNIHYLVELSFTV